MSVQSFCCFSTEKNSGSWADRNLYCHQNRRLLSRKRHCALMNPTLRLSSLSLKFKDTIQISYTFSILSTTSPVPRLSVYMYSWIRAISLCAWHLLISSFLTKYEQGQVSVLLLSYLTKLERMHLTSMSLSYSGGCHSDS